MTNVGETSGREAGGERAGWRALVADESSETRANIAGVLREFDPAVEVVEAATGRAALDVLVAGAPDLAFVNVQLPGMSGAEALAYARAQNARCDLIVLMSNLVLPRWADVSVELEAYEFLKKPFDPQHLGHLLTAFRRMRTVMRVLLVDDSSTARQLVRRVLLGSRFKLAVDETDGGQHALKLMRLASYDLAIIDFHLAGGIDGLETACQAREIAPGTKLILMSGNESAALAQATRHFGVTSFLKKPFYARDVDLALHVAYDLRRPYLLNTLTSAGSALTVAPAKQGAAASARAVARA